MKSSTSSLPVFFLLVAALVFVAVTVNAASSSSSPVTQMWNFTLPSNLFDTSNISYGDPQWWTTDKILSTEGNNNDFVSVTFTNNTQGTFLVTFHPSNGSIVYITRITDDPFPTLSGWPSASLPYSQNPSTVCPEAVCFYIGTMRGVVAVAAESGKILWSKDIFNAPQQVPGHATWTEWIPGQEGLVYVTFENGVGSSAVYVFSPRTGAFVPIHTILSPPVEGSENDVGFTKIWALNRRSITSPQYPNMLSGVMYGSYNTVTQKVGFVCRGPTVSPTYSFPPKITTVWTNWTLTYSPPGLWDQPNEDMTTLYDAAKQYPPAQQDLYSYVEPNVNDREINKIDTATGKIVWTFKTLADVPDYDTYASNGVFYTLMVRHNNTLQLRVIDHLGQQILYSQSNYTDLNGILLVGSGGLFAFGLTSGTVVCTRQRDGKFLGEINTFTSGVTTGVTRKVPGRYEVMEVFFGDANGRYYGYEIQLE